MNNDEIKLRILLAESGELSAREEQELEELLATNEDARTFKVDTRRLTALSRDALPGGEPSSAVMARIREVAAEQAHSGVLFFRPAIRVLAYAAALAIAVSGWFVLSPARNTQADRIGEMHTILQLVAEENLTEVTTDNPTDETTEHDPELLELARQLLIMEGLATDDQLETEVFEAEPPATDLQSHNTPVIPPRRCV